jgi:hypothetical protein
MFRVRILKSDTTDSYFNFMKQRSSQNSAPGEARTHNLRITHSKACTDYKYGALTDCATGAVVVLLDNQSHILWQDTL